MSERKNKEKEKEILARKKTKLIGYHTCKLHNRREREDDQNDFHVQTNNKQTQQIPYRPKTEPR
jgi:hypothetical protein